MVWPSIVNMWKSLAYSLLNREQKHRVLSVHSGICSIPLAVGILSKLDYGDKGSPALPKDSRVKYNTGDSYKYDVLTPSGLEFSLLNKFLEYDVWFRSINRICMNIQHNLLAATTSKNKL